MAGESYPLPNWTIRRLRMGGNGLVAGRGGVSNAMANHVRHRLPHDTRAPRAARRAVDALDRALDPDALEQLRLLVSELVTNAVRHGRPTGGRDVELVIAVRDRSVRVEVADGGDGFAPP